MRAWLAALVLLGTAAPARAEWLKATSRHFTIYSDTSESAIREVATRLERFDGAIRALSGLPDTGAGAANPVAVYVVESTAAIERLVGRPGVAGFYEGRVSGSVAFTPRRRETGMGSLTPQAILFHEYAHHFLLGNAPIAYPAWFSEGYAEFTASAVIDDAGVTLGMGVPYRGRGLFSDTRFRSRTLFSPPEKMTLQQLDQFYGKGWLLSHYLFFDPKRRAAMQDYFAAIDRGVRPIEAARGAFGNLEELDRELYRYLRSRKLPVFVMRNERLPKVDVAVRALSDGERALIEHRMISDRGVDEKSAGPLYDRARRAATPFAGDPEAQGWLAEMAYDARRHQDAEAAADRALAANSKSVQALLYKGLARLARAAEARASDPKVWTEARSWIVAANRLDSNDAHVLSAYYDSFAVQGAPPSAAAVRGLQRALVLAPQDDDLRLQVASQHLGDGKLDDARRVLRPLAYDPHAREDSPGARLLALLDEGKDGRAALAALKAEQDERNKRGDGKPSKR